MRILQRPESGVSLALFPLHILSALKREHSLCVAQSVFFSACHTICTGYTAIFPPDCSTWFQPIREEESLCGPKKKAGRCGRGWRARSHFQFSFGACCENRWGGRKISSARALNCIISQHFTVVWAPKRELHKISWNAHNWKGQAYIIHDAALNFHPALSHTGK